MNQEGRQLQRHFRGTDAFAGWHPDRAQREPLRIKGSGRGRMSLLKSPCGKVVERCYRHGGLRRHVFPLWFLRCRRAQNEFEVSMRALQAGIQTLVPVGFANQAVLAPLLYRYYYYSLYATQAIPFPQVDPQLLGNARTARQVAQQLYLLWQLGIFHTDLNLNNWLWQKPQEKVLLIDFDNAKSHRDDMQTYALRCLKRMLRSVRKLGLQSHRRTLLRFLVTICQKFETDPHQMAEQLPDLAAPIGRIQRFRWKLAGGHQKKS